MYRKLGKNSSQRKALLRNQVTALINNGKIVTTEARTKEVRKIAEHLITLAVKEKDNYETVKVSAKKTSCTIKKLKAKKTYYVKIGTYLKWEGKTLRSTPSKVKKAKVL